MAQKAPVTTTRVTSTPYYPSFRGGEKSWVGDAIKWGTVAFGALFLAQTIQHGGIPDWLKQLVGGRVGYDPNKPPTGTVTGSNDLLQLDAVYAAVPEHVVGLGLGSLGVQVMLRVKHTGGQQAGGHAYQVTATIDIDNPPLPLVGDVADVHRVIGGAYSLVVRPDPAPYLYEMRTTVARIVGVVATATASIRLEVQDQTTAQIVFRRTLPLSLGRQSTVPDWSDAPDRGAWVTLRDAGLPTGDKAYQWFQVPADLTGGDLRYVGQVWHPQAAVLPTRATSLAAAIAVARAHAQEIVPAPGPPSPGPPPPPPPPQIGAWTPRGDCLAVFPCWERTVNGQSYLLQVTNIRDVPWSTAYDDYSGQLYQWLGSTWEWIATLPAKSQVELVGKADAAIGGGGPPPPATTCVAKYDGTAGVNQWYYDLAKCGGSAGYYLYVDVDTPGLFQGTVWWLNPGDNQWQNLGSVYGSNADDGIPQAVAIARRHAGV